MALMALGVSTFMGTSAALATSVTVSGTVGCTATSSTVSASAVAFGEVAKGTIGFASLTPTITQGIYTDCSDKRSDVSAEIDTFTGGALSNLEVDRVIVDIWPLEDGAFPMTAIVPLGAVNGDFGAKVTLILSE
jgi:hypothetical protein